MVPTEISLGSLYTELGSPIVFSPFLNFSHHILASVVILNFVFLFFKPLGLWAVVLGSWMALACESQLCISLPNFMLMELAMVWIFTLWKLRNARNQAFIYFSPEEPVVKCLTAAILTLSLSFIYYFGLGPASWGLPLGKNFLKMEIHLVSYLSSNCQSSVINSLSVYACLWSLSKAFRMLFRLLLSRIFCYLQQDCLDKNCFITTRSGPSKVSLWFAVNWELLWKRY